MQTIFTEISDEEILSVQRISRDQFFNHKEERKSAEILSSSTIFIPQLSFLVIYFQLELESELFYKCQQFLEINGCKLL